MENLAGARRGEGDPAALGQMGFWGFWSPCCHLVAVNEPVGQRDAVCQQLVDDTAMVQAVLGWVTLQVG